ncbi:MAG TPA: restriction endonuclease [Luteimonas sp.]|nr:restriction endonuclease [Luteimonas sp.]
MRGLKQVRNRRDDALTRVGWEKFEGLLADYYRRQGYQVDHVGTGSGRSRFDGGIDLKLRRDGEYIVVQCKHWNAYQVTHNDVHQLLGIMVNESATGAILINSGEFTRYARESAAKLGHVQLIDGDELRRMIGPIAEPEARRQPMAAMRPSVESFAAVVGERLLSAAEDRIRGRRRERSPHELMLRLVLVMVVLFALWLFVQGMLKAVSAALIHPVASNQTTAPVSARPVLAPNPSRPSAVSQPAQTYVSGPLMRERTEAERREAKRQADEAAKVLEASTPEM